MSNFDKIENSKMAAIAIWTFIENNISHKVIELELHFGVKPYVSNTNESFGTAYLLLYGVRLLQNPILLSNMRNIHFLISICS